MRVSWNKALSIVAVAMVFGCAVIAQTSETILSETENAYGPIPSPNGSKIAYVRTGWGHTSEDGTVTSSGFGRSSLQSRVFVMDSKGKILNDKTLVTAFLADWTPDGKYLICFRNWQYFLVPIDGSKLIAHSRRRDKLDPVKRDYVAERASYLPEKDSFIWVDRSAIVSSRGFISDGNAAGRILIPSPNGRYIATAGDELSVYDRQTKTWAHLGRLTIHPARDWDYIKPSWNPWFRDSSKLAFVSNKAVMIATPDGKTVRKLTKSKPEIGLAVPSPDGKKVAFASFCSRPRKNRSDLKFYGGSIWTVDLSEGRKPKPVTKYNEDQTYTLRWLNTRQLVFDRITDKLFYRRSRLWKATITR
ncbi:MAG: hypothetical protein HKN25_17540 [Pyrinomonadaceae bacterium]|nr:hypothetical protein [Pyrinomonadaceae bacterium]